jgi:hypothetical protein
MNFPRIAIAAVAAWLVSLPVGFVANDFLLADIHAANSAAMRPAADITGNLPIGFVFLLVGFFAFAYTYAKGYEGGHGPMEGVRFGVLVALIVVGFGLIWQYVLYPIDATMSAAMIVDSVVELAIYGAVVGAIYRPEEKAAVRRAAAR